MENLNDEKKSSLNNIDTEITEVRYIKANDQSSYREIDSVEVDENGRTVRRVIKEIEIDGCDTPITDTKQIVGKCKVCGRRIVAGNEIKCEGRCGEFLDKRCYQHQGSHVLHGRRYCRFDYWMTKLIWQHLSPSLKRSKGGGKNEPPKESGRDAVSIFKDGKQIWLTQQRDRQPNPLDIIASREPRSRAEKDKGI